MEGDYAKTSLDHEKRCRCHCLKLRYLHGLVVQDSQDRYLCMFLDGKHGRQRRELKFCGGTKFVKLDIIKIGSIISSKACSDKRNLSESCRNVHLKRQTLFGAHKCCRCFLPREKWPSVFPHFRAMDPMAAAGSSKWRPLSIPCHKVNKRLAFQNKCPQKHLGYCGYP